MKKIPRFWITGTAVALVGVVIARVVAPALENAAGDEIFLAVKVLGHVVALAGIFLIARGIFKNHSGDAA